LSDVKAELEGSGMTSEVAEVEADKLGPYKYTRTFVICRGDQYEAATSQPPANTGLGSEANPDNAKYPAEFDCKVDPLDSGKTRVEWLTCEPEDIAMVKGEGSQEKKIKVLCTWYSREGRCHSVHLDTTVVDL
jgi:hypothetical protein